MHRQEVIVIPKPPSVSWEEISQVLQKAHKENAEKGVIMPFPFMRPDEIRKKIENRGGVMFVALLDGQLIGTGATYFIDKNFWCGNGLYAYNCFVSVLPEHAGKGVYKKLALKQEEYIKSKHVNRIFFDTHEKNKRIIEVSRKNGYEFVNFILRKKHNSIYMVKWLDNPPYTHFQCVIKFWKLKIRKKYRAYKKEFKKKLHL